MAAPMSGRIHPARPGIVAAGIFMSTRGRPCMTWLYIPPRALTPAARRACSAYRSAPAPAGSTPDLSWPNPDTVLWVTSSGTPSPRPSSWRGWRIRPWIRRLSGTTLPASTAGRGAVNLVSAGYPCQPFSVAGRRRGTDDPRHLWPHVARVVRAVLRVFEYTPARAGGLHRRIVIAVENLKTTLASFDAVCRRAIFHE